MTLAKRCHLLSWRRHHYTDNWHLGEQSNRSLYYTVLLHYTSADWKLLSFLATKAFPEHNTQKKIFLRSWPTWHLTWLYCWQSFSSCPSLSCKHVTFTWTTEQWHGYGEYSLFRSLSPTLYQGWTLCNSIEWMVAAAHKLVGHFN